MIEVPDLEAGFVDLERQVGRGPRLRRVRAPEAVAEGARKRGAPGLDVKRGVAHRDIELIGNLHRKRNVERLVLWQ